jgi:hypothetical protein
MLLGDDNNEDDSNNNCLAALNVVDDDIENNHVLARIAETAMLLEDCSATDADTADDMRTALAHSVEADRMLTLRNMNKDSPRIHIINAFHEFSMNTYWACEPDITLAFVAPGPKVALEENKKVPDLGLGMMSTAYGTGHIEPVVTATSENGKNHETCESYEMEGYAGDTEYDGIDQVTGDLKPVWTPMVSTCSRQPELEILGDSEHRTFGLEPHGTVSMVTKTNENILNVIKVCYVKSRLQLRVR